ncbi:MAG: hypothetical protein RI907_3807 [Pseudomonadota bacterium]|jgi:hypothetical protein
MHVHIAGSGKLAQELLARLPSPTDRPADAISPWPATGEAPCIVVHAGSGRELDAIVDHCRRTGSVLLELSTGSSLGDTPQGFPVVLCPNTNILMLKFMAMLARSGGLFQGLNITLTESHQAGKMSVPGTAVALAQALGLPDSAIQSVREPAVQQAELGIPPEALARHAFHRIDIADEACAIRLETRVVGNAPYADGVRQIIAAVRRQPLAPRCYAINEFIELGWL